MNRIEVVTPPAIEPVALNDVKSFLRVNHSDDDALISGFISEARAYAEGFTSLAFIHTQFVQREDVPNEKAKGWDIKFRRGPFHSLNKIELKQDQWGDIRTAEIYFTAGFGGVGYDLDRCIPATIKTAIMLTVDDWYKNREVTKDKSDRDVPQAVNALLWAYKQSSGDPDFVGFWSL
jgi:hypothetical protein